MKIKLCGKLRWGLYVWCGGWLAWAMTSGAVAGDRYVRVLDTTASTVTVGNVATYVAGIKTGAPATGGISCFKLDEGSMIVASCSDLRVMVSCTADGVPYYPGMRVAGGALLYLYMRSASSSASVMIESGVNEYESIGHVEATNWNGITYGLHIPTGFVLPSTITYECRMDVSASGFSLHDLSVGYVASHRRSITFSSLNGITISEPRPMVGPPGREVRTDFTVSVSSDVSFPFKWEVAAPCSNWNPYLKVGGAGEVIGVGEVGVGSTLGRETPVTAYFTPTEMGNFSCPATMTFYID